MRHVLVLRTAAAAALTLTLFSPARTAAQVKVNEDARLSADFVARVKAYVDLHNKLEGTLPHLPDKPTPDQLNTHQRALGRLIAQARVGAGQGALLSRDTRAYLRRQIVRALATPEGPSLRSSILDENPGRIQLQVNGRYPDGVPFATTPPQILAALPRLPDEVEYRFIGDRLLLLDVHAQIVADYMEGALPR